jgi:hypothetical protein
MFFKLYKGGRLVHLCATTNSAAPSLRFLQGVGIRSDGIKRFCGCGTRPSGIRSQEQSWPTLTPPPYRLLHPRVLFEGGHDAAGTYQPLSGGLFAQQPSEPQISPFFDLLDDGPEFFVESRNTSRQTLSSGAITWREALRIDAWSRPSPDGVRCRVSGRM